MRRLKIFVLLFLGVFSLSAQNLSSNSKIYILTCSPGAELYQAFGHNAIWILDNNQRISQVYHYGTFDFSAPHFYTNFIRGRLNYMLDIELYKYFHQEYNGDHRDVYAQELNLNLEQKNSIYKYLSWKSQPENKYYKYDFFMDNCATRVRDVLEQIFADTIVFPKIKIDLTYRQAIKPYLRAKPWIRFGTNLLLGLPADKKLDYWSAMFLPDYIDTVFNSAKLVYSKNNVEPLVLSRSTIIKNNFKIGKKPWFNPSLVFWSILIIFIAISLLEIKKKKFFKGIDFSIYLILGIVSLILIFMWFGTDHTPTKWNLNLIWAFPSHIWFAFVYLKNKRKKLIKYYSLIFGLVNILLCITFPIFPQHFDQALIPFFILLGGRMLKEFWEATSKH